MKAAIAILTYNRLPALQKMLEGLGRHCGSYPLAVFEDCGSKDETTRWLMQRAHPHLRDDGSVAVERDDLLATEFNCGTFRAFLGKRNLGVAGQSNRALKWFMDETDADQLCLCNDDLEVLGDFPKLYGQAHQDLAVGLFCFNDFWESPTHRWVIARSRGYRVKIFPRMTGIMMSVLRKSVNAAGYFDTRFGRFGEEHCDWTNRLRYTGQIKLDGIDQPCLDIEPTLPNGNAGPPVLKHQDIPTSMTGAERAQEDAKAVEAIREAALRYMHEPHYRPFTLIWPAYAGGSARQGIQTSEMPGYKLVTSS